MAGPQGVPSEAIFTGFFGLWFVVWCGVLVGLSSVKKIFLVRLDNGDRPGKLEGLPRGWGLRERVSARWVSVS